MPSLSGTISDVCRIPYLSDARLTEIGHDDDGQIDFIEYQASHLVREYPEELDVEIGRPSKKTVISQHLVRFDRKLGKLSADYFQVGPPMIQDASLKFRHYSPSFKWSLAGLMKATDPSGTPKPFLQIWRDESFVAEIDLSKEHGDFATDEFFGWVGWDEKADLFIYQAEAPEPKPGKADFKYNPPFGEVIPTRRNTMVFVFDLNARKIKTCLDLSEHETPTQIVYVQKEKAVYFVGYETLPKRYGIMYCLNRPCHLYRWAINGKAIEQMPSARQAPSITYPVYDPHGDRILFMGTHVGGSHYHAFSLYSLDLSNQQVEVLVKDEDMDPERINGLFPIGNPQQTMGKHGTFFISSFLRTQKTILGISPSDLRIATPTEGDEEKSWRLHQVHENIILASCSSRVSPPRLYVGLVSDRGLIDWFPIIKETSVDLLSGFEQQIHNVDKFVDIIVTRPKGKEAKEMPLIIFPHGGPNFSYVSEYSVFSSLAASLGFSCAASTRSFPLHHALISSFSKLYRISWIRDGVHQSPRRPNRNHRRPRCLESSQVPRRTGRLFQGQDGLVWWVTWRIYCSPLVMQTRVQL